LSDQPLIEIQGVDPGPYGQSDLESSPKPWYAQFLSAPDVAQQTRDVLTRPAPWEVQRSDLRSLSRNDAAIKVQAAAYPDLFAIAQKEDGSLRVTRLATQPESYDGATTDDSELADQNPAGADAANPGTSDQSSAHAQAEDDLNRYVRCDSVKQ